MCNPKLPYLSISNFIFVIIVNLIDNVFEIDLNYLKLVINKT